MRFNLGRALAAKGDLEGARVQFQEAVNRRRSFLPPRLALLELAQARHDYKASVQYADEILAIYPALMRIKLVHATSLMYVGKDAEAKAELTALENLPQRSGIADAIGRNEAARKEISGS